MSAESEATVVPMHVEWQPAWLSWVAATTTCLRALGHEVDTADVAGMSGYAFILSVHRELCPSGPTVFDWYTLLEGVQLLGRSALCFASGDCHSAERPCDRTRAHCHAAYDVVAREVAAGRPCVLWGAYVPEFAVAVGVEDGCFRVKSYREGTGEPQPPVPCEALNAPGGPYVLAFPTPVAMSQERADTVAIARAAQTLSQPRFSQDYGYGSVAYDVWIAALDAGIAHPFGNAYNAQCWAEGRRFAYEFLRRVAGRNAHLAEPLNLAVGAYSTAAAAMTHVASLFPFPGGDEVQSPAVRAEAIDALRRAQSAESQAAEAIRQAALIPPPAA